MDKELIQQKADEIAWEEFNQEFYDMDELTKDKIYARAIDWYVSRSEHRHDQFEDR